MIRLANIPIFLFLTWTISWGYLVANPDMPLVVPFQDVKLTSLKKADKTALNLIKQIESFAQNQGKDAKKDYLAYFIYAGKELPAKVSWVINHLNAQGYNITVQVVDPQSLNESFISNHPESAENKLPPENLATKFLFDNPLNVVEPIEGGMLNRVKKLKDQMGLKTRFFFGIPKGQDWGIYVAFAKDIDRKDMFSSLFTAMVASGLHYAGTMKKALDSGDLMDPTLSAQVTFGIIFALNIIHRGTYAFFGQGKSIHQRRGFVDNRSFFLMWQYVHSVVVSTVVLLAANSPAILQMHGQALAGYLGETLVYVMVHSLLGTFGKFKWQLLIAQKQKNVNQGAVGTERTKVSKVGTQLQHFAFGLSWSALKALHLFNIDSFNAKYAFVVFGVVGILSEMHTYLMDGKTNVRLFSKKALMNRLNILRETLRLSLTALSPTKSPDLLLRLQNNLDRHKSLVTHLEREISAKGVLLQYRRKLFEMGQQITMFKSPTANKPMPTCEKLRFGLFNMRPVE